jgi:DivIVA domain-containing protein
MDIEQIERLRVQGFTAARRGYDQHEVDRFLADLMEWIETDAARDLGDAAVKRKLELVGKSTAQILLATEKESEELRAHM